MAAPSCYVESLICSAKRLRISPAAIAPITTRRPQRRCITTESSGQPATTQQTPPPSVLTTSSAKKSDTSINDLRLPKAVQAVFLTPLKRAPTHGIPVCDLQIRSYSLRNLDVWTDFCLRAAYYLNLAAKGPVPLPRITERWTVPRANFVHKKSQENFERVTLRRLIQIQDGHPETVALWLAYIQKHRYYGIGMKANVFEYGGLEVAKDLDAESVRLHEALGSMPQNFLRADESRNISDTRLEDMLVTQPFKAQWGAYGPMAATGLVQRGRRRFRRVTAKGEQSNENFVLRQDAVMKQIRLEQ